MQKFHQKCICFLKSGAKVLPQKDTTRPKQQKNEFFFTFLYFEHNFA